MEQRHGTSVAPARSPGEVVGRHVAAASAALEAATCGHPLCRIGDGPDVMRPKFAEGGLAAATELERSMARRPTSEPWRAASEMLAAWEAERRSCQDHGGPRIGYLNGGIAQLRNIVAELDPARAAAPSS